MKKPLIPKNRSSLILKLTLKMKLSIVLLFLSIFFVNAKNLHGQGTKITLDLQNVRVERLIDEIESTTGFRFIYKLEDVNLNRTISIVAYDEDISAVLERAFKSSKTDFKLNDKEQIFLIKRVKNPNDNGIAASIPQQTVSGIVRDENETPLPGASVMEKGTANGTVTDFDGNFAITVEEDAVLEISYLGYQSVDISVDGRSKIEIQLQIDTDRLDEVVVIGYGTSERKNLTGAVAKVQSRSIANIPEVGFEQKIIGQLPGVNVQQTTGTPGGNVSIKIRGTSSISAGNEPLIIIDGFPVSDSNNSSTVQGSRPSNATRRENPQNSLSTLNPNDIESIEVLKDASAAAIYGSRGSNGVILITTKRGKEGKPTISFNAYNGLQEIITTYDMMDAHTFAEQHYISRLNSGTLSGYPDAYVPYLNDVPGLPSTDWQDALFRTAQIQNYDLSVRGGTEKIGYYVSGNYFNQEGIILGSGFERFTFRSNLDAKISDKVKLSVNLNPSYADSDLVPAENPYFVDGVVNLALLSIPTDPIYNEDGSFNFNQNTAAGSGPFVNPIALATGVDDRLQQFRFLGGIRLDAEIYKNLTVASSFGFDSNSFRRDYYRPSWIPVRGAQGPSNPEARSFSSQLFNWVNENTLNYDFNLGEHNKFNFLLGFTAQKERIERNGLFANNFANDLVRTLNAGQVYDGFSQIQEWSLLSYLSRITFNHKDKYLINASIRRDGSSRFGENTKWGWFPSASVGWRVSGEEFFPESVVFSDLKIRASIGQTGNFSIPNYGSVALLEEADYVLGDTVVNGLAPDTSPNSDLSWEKTTMTNFGLDLGLFEDSVLITADYFVSNTNDLLINLPVPGSSGFSTSLQNIGEVENKGFELGIKTNFSIGDLQWSTSLNFATLSNEVISLGRIDEPIISSGGIPNTHITQAGSPIGSYFGYTVLGVYTSQDQIDGTPSFSDTQVGDFIFEDTNGDGVLNPDDRTTIGDFFPDFTYGFTNQFQYKNIDFSFLIQGAQNFEVFHLAQRYLGSLQTFSNYRNDIYQNAYFSPENPGNGQIHRPNASPTGDNDATSSYYVEDGSYLRVRNITLGYTINKSNSVRIPVDSFRIYVTAQNPFTITDYPGYNPEVNMRPEDPLSQGEDYGTYPLPRSLIVGINLTL